MKEARRGSSRTPSGTSGTRCSARYGMSRPCYTVPLAPQHLDSPELEQGLVVGTQAVV